MQYRVGARTPLAAGAAACQLRLCRDGLVEQGAASTVSDGVGISTSMLEEHMTTGGSCADALCCRTDACKGAQVAVPQGWLAGTAVSCAVQQFLAQLP